MADKNPFGLRSCEKEVRFLGTKEYTELYFDEAPFNDIAIDRDTYLIIGRRGSGKTSLSRYFSFQEKMPNPLCIEVLKGRIYQEVLSDISKRTSVSRVIAIPYLRRVWEFVIWSLIDNAITPRKVKSGHNKKGEEEKESERESRLVAHLISHLMNFFKDDDEGPVGPKLERIVDDAGLDEARRKAKKIAGTRPIIISIDTLEQYDLTDDALMYALAALIEYANEFNQEYSPFDIHLKVFVAGEVFPYLKEAVILNPLKTVQDPVYLLWRPRDLLRLIGWRFHYYLEHKGYQNGKETIDWEDDDDVLEKVWIPHFGRTLENTNGLTENTWTYILRHTQMRPRQLVVICNIIANRAIKSGTFPKFEKDQIIGGVQEAEMILAGEILNSYSEIYKNVDRIAAVGLSNLPKIFQGNELDKRASQSASEWQDEYTPGRFKQLVAELGIIGRVTRENIDSAYLDADFEYASEDRLILTHQDRCVVHPMFYKKLNIDINSNVRVMPFTTPR